MLSVILLDFGIDLFLGHSSEFLLLIILHCLLREIHHGPIGGLIELSGPSCLWHLLDAVSHEARVDVIPFIRNTAIRKLRWRRLMLWSLKSHVLLFSVAPASFTDLERVTLDPTKIVLSHILRLHVALRQDTSFIGATKLIVPGLANVRHSHSILIPHMNPLSLRDNVARLRILHDGLL